jgi:5-methylthioadenosine/S-adenosylhomocysteine deaminase
LGEITAIANGVVITVDRSDTIYEDGAVIVEDGRIIDVGKSDEVLPKYRKDFVIDAKKRAVLPGFVNAHFHSGIIRGVAEDLALWDWLRKYIDPKHRVLTPSDAHASSKLCYTESIKAGVTTVLDMERFMDRCADSAEEVGLRAVLAPYVSDKFDGFEKPEDNYRLLADRNGSANGRVNVWLGMEHLMYCSEELYRKGAELARKHNVGIHTHGEESKEMAERITKEHGGRRPTKVLRDYGILGPRTVLAHCVWLDDEEMRIIAETKTAVAHCPVSNFKLASGVARVPEMLGLGILVGLGSDGIEENNRIDLMQEMKMAGLIQKGTHRDATLMPAKKLLRMATIDGATALGLGGEVGSIEPGKKADISILDLNQPHLTPALNGESFNVVSNIVYAAEPHDVLTVLVDGRVVMENRKIAHLNEQEIIEDATKASVGVLERIKELVPPDIKSK